MWVCYCLRYRKLATLYLHLVNPLWINIRSCNIMQHSHIVTVQDLATKPEFACAPFVLRRCKRLQRSKAKVSIILRAKKRCSKWMQMLRPRKQLSQSFKMKKCNRLKHRLKRKVLLGQRPGLTLWDDVWLDTMERNHGGEPWTCSYLFIIFHNVEAHRESWMQPWTSMNSIYSICMHLQVWAAVWRCCCRGPKRILII